MIAEKLDMTQSDAEIWIVRQTPSGYTRTLLGPCEVRPPSPVEPPIDASDTVSDSETALFYRGNTV